MFVQSLVKALRVKHLYAKIYLLLDTNPKPSYRI